MNETTIATIVLAVVAVIPATIAAWAALATARQGKKLIAKTDENTALTKDTKQALDEVHTQTNGHLSKVTQQLDAANSKLESSQEHNKKLEMLLISLAELTKKNGSPRP